MNSRSGRPARNIIAIVREDDQHRRAEIGLEQDEQDRQAEQQRRPARSPTSAGSRAAAHRRRSGRGRGRGSASSARRAGSGGSRDRARSARRRRSRRAPACRISRRMHARISDEGELAGALAAGCRTGRCAMHEEGDEAHRMRAAPRASATAAAAGRDRIERRARRSPAIAHDDAQHLPGQDRRSAWGRGERHQAGTGGSGGRRRRARGWPSAAARRVHPLGDVAAPALPRAAAALPSPCPCRTDR